MALQDLYLAKQELIALLQNEEGFVGVGITTEGDNISNMALQVLVRSEDSPVVAKIPQYHGLYMVLHRAVGDIAIQEMGIGDTNKTSDTEDTENE